MESIVEGLQALQHQSQLNYATSTKNRFNDFALENKLILLEQDYPKTKEVVIHDGKPFEVLETFKQCGYGAWHIGSKIDGIRREGRIPLIINTKRNRRVLCASLEVDDNGLCNNG